MGDVVASSMLADALVDPDAGIAFRLARPSRGVRQILVLSGLLEVVELTD